MMWDEFVGLSCQYDSALLFCFFFFFFLGLAQVAMLASGGKKLGLWGK